MADDPTATAAGGVSLHEPTVARRSDGKWGVFCTACSNRAGDYVYPCEAFPNDPEWPPAVLALSDQVHDLWEYARQQKMYDAQDWIAAHWRGEDLDVKHG